MRYFNLLVALLGSLYFALSFLFPGRSLRDWRQKAMTFLGVLGIAFVAWSVYGIAYVEELHTHCAGSFFLAKGLLLGAVLGILVVLGLEGSFNLLDVFRGQAKPKLDSEAK